MAPIRLNPGHRVAILSAMIQVGTAELKARLGAYLALVRAGETIDITSYRRSIARLVPAAEDEPLIEEPIDPPEAVRTLERLPAGRTIPALTALLADRRRR